MPDIKQYEGDFRMWKKAANGDLTPVLPSTTDPHGNTPVEANAAVFSYTAGDEKKITSKRRDRYEQTIYSDQLPGESSLSLTLLELPGAVLARIFYGEEAETTKTGTAVTDESVTVTAKGVELPLANRYLASTPAVVITDATGATTYVADTDYTVNARTGAIVILPGSAIAVDDVLKVSYTYEDYTLLTIRGGVQPLETYYITGDLLNRPDKQDASIEIYEAKLGNDGDVDLFSSDPLTATMKGTLVTPDDKNEPYIVKAYTKAAA